MVHSIFYFTGIMTWIVSCMAIAFYIAMILMRKYAEWDCERDKQK